MIPRSLFLLLALIPFLCQATKKTADQKKLAPVMTLEKCKYIARRMAQHEIDKQRSQLSAASLTLAASFILEYMAYIFFSQKGKNQTIIKNKKFLFSQLIIVPSTVYVFSFLKKLLGIDKQIDFHSLNENEKRFVRSIIK